MMFLGVKAQETTDDKPKVKFSGFVKTDIYTDTRQMESLREGHLAIYPKAPLNDKNGKDINDINSINIQAIQTRGRVDLLSNGPWGSKLSGAIEAEFFGVSNSDVNGVRMRHAYGKINWDHTEILTGQFWNPMFVTDCFASTLSFNTGIPYQPFSRNPQIRFTYKTGNIKLIAAALAERDFTSVGINGVPSNDYLRNSGVPIISFQLHFSLPSIGLLTGIGTEYKKIRPELQTSLNYENTNTVEALSYIAFAKFQTNSFQLKLQSSLLENSYNFVGLGGYASTHFDTLTNIRKYTPITWFNGWIDLQYQPGQIQFGLFGGLAYNMGTKLNILPSQVFARAKDMAQSWRISPRILYVWENFSTGVEIEYTTASFGTINNKGQIKNTNEVANTRSLLVVYYNF